MTDQPKSDVPATPGGPPAILQLEMNEMEKVFTDLACIEHPASLRDVVSKLINQGARLELIRTAMLAWVDLMMNRRYSLARAIVENYLTSLERSTASAVPPCPAGPGRPGAAPSSN